MHVGDEWKIELSTASGHYEYMMVPYGLSCSPSVFLCFINVLRDKYVIAHTDNILIYSPSLESHVKKVLSHLLENQLYVKV